MTDELAEVRLAGRAAVVTGSTKGIGFAIARAFLREGARVVINSRNAADCQGVAKELGPAAIPLPADLSRSDEVRRLAREATEALGGRVDILVKQHRAFPRRGEISVVMAVRANA